MEKEIFELLQKMDKRFDGIDKRLDIMDNKLTNLESEISEIKTTVNNIQNQVVNLTEFKTEIRNDVDTLYKMNYENWKEVMKLKNVK